MPSFRILFTVAGLLAAYLGYSQNATDALRFSSFDVVGSSRFIGSGSSLSALGTEFSVLSTNPAGLALYRSSELVVTPAYQFSSTRSTLEGAFFPDDPGTLLDNFSNGAVKDTKGAFALNNLGFVVHSQPRSRIFTTFNFGVGLNKLANFNQAYTYRGSSVGSIVERWQEFANEYGVDPNDNVYEESLALQTDALFYDEQQDFYFTDYDATLDPDFIGAPVWREQTVDIEGSMSELVFSLGANVKEMVMVGLTIGVPILNYRVDRSYAETDPDDLVPFFEDLSFEESIRTTGQGINAKLGLIFRASQALRFGLAVHSPSSITLNDESSFGIGYTYTEQGQTKASFAESDRLTYAYRLNTPWRFFGSAGFLFGKSGFLSAEVEFVDYSSNAFRFRDYPQDEQIANEDISTSLSSVVNVRLGGEFAYKVFRARAGVGLMPSAYEGSSDLNPTLSGGLGVRLNSFFVDLAYRYRTESSGLVPYGTFYAPQQFIDQKATYQTFFLSVGVRY